MFAPMFKDVLSKGGSRPAEVPATAVRNGEEKPKSEHTVNRTDGETYFTEDVEFKGTLAFTSKAHIDGRMEGEIVAEGPLVIGEKALIKATIHGTSVTIKGKVQGNVVGTEKVQLMPGSQLYGDVKTPKFIMSEGVTFVGNSNTLEGRAPEAGFNEMFSRLGKNAKKETI
jgi:cytoskeletal protein CcmA (bactofilin family)